MPYIVERTPRASAQLSALSDQHRAEFERICSLLAVEPHRLVGSPIVRVTLFDGDRLWMILIAGFSFAIHYKVFEPESGSIGIVIILKIRARST